MTSRVPNAVIQGTFQRWAIDSLRGEGSLTFGSFLQWSRAQPDRPPSAPTMQRRFGTRTWGETVLARRHEIVDLVADSATLEVEVPVECIATGRFRWGRRRLQSWADAPVCRCGLCIAPSVAMAYPDVVRRLIQHSDAVRSSLVPLRWHCPEGDPSHAPTLAPARDIAEQNAPCRGCRAREVFHRRHPPGQVAPPADDWHAGSAAERSLVRLLRHVAPKLDVRHGWRVALHRTGPMSVTPSFVLPAAALAVVVGRQLDRGTEVLLDSVGWRLVIIDTARQPDDAITTRILAATAG